MAIVYLGLGSNLGNKEQNLNDAILQIGLEAGNILSISSFYQSAPWGFDSENSFLNAVMIIST